jgi:hypothetical protein
MDHLTVEPADAQAIERPRRDRVHPRPSSGLAWGLWLLVVLVEGLVVAFLLKSDALSAHEWVGALATWLPFLAFATVGALILARRPGNRILLFPTGRLLSPRWRPVAWTLGLVTGLHLTARLLMPVPVGPGLPANPLELAAAEGLLQRIQAIAGVAPPILALAVVASLVLRFHRSQGDERQQLTWLTYAVVIDLAVPWTVGVAAERWAPLLGQLVVFPVAASLIPIAIGVAVLKYRLYDLDRVINRTLVYTLLTVLLGAVYAAGVFLIGRLLDPADGQSELAVAASTLAVAAVFQPARRRIQAVVDRRFNRRRYNAAKTVQAFSARLRDEWVVI